MGNLKQEIASSLPGILKLPEEFAAAIDWIESVGAVGTFKSSGKPYGMLDPAFLTEPGGSLVSFQPMDADHAMYWTGNKDKAVTDRLGPIVRTGGDGSYAALWLDDAGQQQIVHMGSGSGSVMTGVMVRTPVDFLRLLAIGYEELCWPEALGEPPAAMDEDEEEETAGLVKPVRFAQWVASTYGVTIPATALEIMLPPSHMDKPSDDPFCVWMDRIRG